MTVALEAFGRDVVRISRRRPLLMLAEFCEAEDGTITLMIRPQDGDHLAAWSGDLDGNCVVPREVQL